MAMTRVLMQQLCLPMHCDLFGRCLGGKVRAVGGGNAVLSVQHFGKGIAQQSLCLCRSQVLSWIDLAAAFAAGMAANGPIVTASVDAVHFVKPLHVGRIAILEAMVNW